MSRRGIDPGSDCVSSVLTRDRRNHLLNRSKLKGHVYKTRVNKAVDLSNNNRPIHLYNQATYIVIRAVLRT